MNTQPPLSHLTARLPTDPDVMADICQALAAAGHPNPQAWTQDPAVAAAHLPANPAAQRFHINRYWRARLIALPQPTQAERFVLQDDASDARMPHPVYMRHFATRVAPTIVQAGL